MVVRLSWNACFDSRFLHFEESRTYDLVVPFGLQDYLGFTTRKLLVFEFSGLCGLLDE